LYVAVEPTTGESFCLYLPRLDGECFEVFLKEFEKSYPDEEVVLVLDGAAGHRSGEVQWPSGIEGLRLPARSPELNPAERWFEELRARLSNRIFESEEEMMEALTEALRPSYWEAPEVLARLVGYGWWMEGISNIRTSA
jgi:transposase